MKLIRTEAREWIKDPNHRIVWYRDNKPFRKAPADDLSIINGFYSYGAELVEIVTKDDALNESASFEITLLPQNGDRELLIEIILNLYTAIIELLPDAHASWDWKIKNRQDRRVISVSFYGTCEI